MPNLIAIIKLAPGEVGYYDELTRIHLTLSRPTANVLDYMNTSRLRRSIMTKTLVLVAGSLNTTARDLNTPAKIEEVKIETPVVVEEENKVINPTIEVQEVIAEPIELVTETSQEEVIQITPKKSNTKKKKKED